MSSKGGLTPKGTAPRGRGPGEVAPAKRPGRNRPAIGFDPVTKTWIRRTARKEAA